MSSKRAVASNPSETGEFSSGPRPFRSQAVAEDPSGVTGGPAPWRFNYPPGDLAERVLGRGRERGYRRLEQTANTAGTDANHPRDFGPVMEADVPADPRRIPFTTWASERDVALLCLDRVRFESVPTIGGRDGLRRRVMSPQLAWEARRKHAPCAIPIPPEWGMDCHYMRVDSEKDYVRRLWELTAPNPRSPAALVHPSVICQDRPLLPLRWPPSGRKTENPEREFSPKGSYNLPGEAYARDSKYALYLSSLLAGHGDPGRFFEEIRKEQANRRHGLLVSWLHVEYYRVPSGMRSSLYPRVPQDWDEWEAPRNMNVPLPAVLVYRGSGLLRGDPLHWCIFRTEWVISVFSRFIADAYHRGLLWRLPSRVTRSVEALGVEVLLEGSSYHSDAAHQLLKLQAEYPWDELIRAGYTSVPAVPIQRVGEEFQICELPPSGNRESMAVPDDGSDVEEILASGVVGTTDGPGTPPSPDLQDPMHRLGGDTVTPRQGTFEVGLRDRAPHEDRAEISGHVGSFMTHTYPTQVGAERVPTRRTNLLPTSGEPYTAWTPYGVLSPAPVSEYLQVREVEEYMRYHNRWEELREYTRGNSLTATTVGRALCALLESREFHRHRGADLARRIQDLEEEQRTKGLLDQATDQTLRLINTELTGLTERFHRQVTHEGEGKEEDELAEGTEEMRMRKRTRTGP